MLNTIEPQSRSECSGSPFSGWERRYNHFRTVRRVFTHIIHLPMTSRRTTLTTNTVPLGGTTAGPGPVGSPGPTASAPATTYTYTTTDNTGNTIAAICTFDDMVPRMFGAHSSSYSGLYTYVRAQQDSHHSSFCLHHGVQVCWHHLFTTSRSSCRKIF